jgi:hypothetical protein
MDSSTYAVVADGCVREAAVRADCAVCAYGRVAEEDGLGHEDGVLAHGHIGADPDLVGVEHGDAGEHQLMVDAALHDLRDLSKLGTVVDAEDLGSLRCVVHADRLAFGDEDLDEVREVVLALGVVVADLVEVVGKTVAAEAVRRGVALFERLALLLGAVLVLDDGRDLALLVQDDAAIARAVVWCHGQHRAGGMLRLALLHEGGKRLRLYERSVSCHHKDRTGEAADCVAHDADGMAGAETLCLLDELDRCLSLRDRFMGEEVAYLIGAIADNDNDTRSASLAGCADTPPHERLVQYLVHDLGVTRLHARTLACSEDNRGKWHRTASNEVAMRESSKLWLLEGACCSLTEPEQSAARLMIAQLLCLQQHE